MVKSQNEMERKRRDFGNCLGRWGAKHGLRQGWGVSKPSLSPTSCSFSPRTQDPKVKHFQLGGHQGGPGRAALPGKG